MRRRVVLSVFATAGATALSAALLGPPAHGAAPGTTRSPGVVRVDGVLSGTLVRLEAAPARAAATLSLPESGPGSLVRAADGRVLVQVDLTATDEAVVEQLRDVGTVLHFSGQMSRATMLIAPDRLPTLARVAAVRYADMVPSPVHGTALRAPGAAAAGASAGLTAAAARRCDPRPSEADSQLRADLARRTFGIDGTGVTVGVISDSYDRDPNALTFASEDVRSGALPGPGNPCGRTDPVDVLADGTGGSRDTDEGRAMLQAVHSLAPGADLAFATGYGGADLFADNIVALQRAGAEVIVDDLTYFTEPFFQEGVLDRAIDTVTDRGAVYLSSAGNSNTVLGGRDVSSWETPAVRLGGCPSLDLDPVEYGPIGVCTQFDPAGTDPGYGMTIAPGGSVLPVLQWAEPFYGVTDDFDLFLVDSATQAILASSTVVQSSSRTPVEYLSWTNQGAAARQVELVVNRFSGSGTPRLKVAFVTMSGLLALEHDRSVGGDVVGPTVFGHNGGPDTISVAAVPYNDATRVEAYSARGPVTHYFGPVKGTRVAPRLTAPRVVAAPQVAATDGYGTTFFGVPSGGTYRFFGTSAAAPAVAAVAALVRETNPGLAPGRVRAALQQTARRLAGVPASAAGSGLVDARAVVALVRPPGSPTVTRTKARTKAPGTARVWFDSATVLPTAALTGYDARCRSEDGGDPGQVTRSGAGLDPLTVSGLDRGKTYRCSVRARTAWGAGAYSADGAATVVRGVPSKPRHARASAVGRSVVLTFAPPRNTGGLRLAGFVGTCLAHGRTRTASAGRDATSLTVTRLSPGTRYRCEVRATNKVGPSKASRELRVRVPA